MLLERLGGDVNGTITKKEKLVMKPADGLQNCPHGEIYGVAEKS